MALQNVEANITLDLYNHDTTPATVKAIQLDSQTRYVAAMLQSMGAEYGLDSGATVQLIVIRPDKVGVQITGTTFTYGDESAQFLGPYAELTQAALAVSGKMRGQFKITSGTQILRTEIFAISNGEALDASTDEWADEYDGYNLEEMATSIETNTADIATLEADVSQIKEDLNNVLDISTDTASYYNPYVFGDSYIPETIRCFYDNPIEPNTILKSVTVPVGSVGANATITVDVWELGTDGDTLTKAFTTTISPSGNTTNIIDVNKYSNRIRYVSIMIHNTQIFYRTNQTGNFFYTTYNVDPDTASLSLSGLTKFNNMILVGGYDYVFHKYSATKNEIHVGYGCEFEEIQDALDTIIDDSADNPYTIFVHPRATPYKRFSMIRKLSDSYPWTNAPIRYISLIGEDKYHCVIKDDTGNYSKPPAEILTNGLIKNLAFVATHDNQDTSATQGSYAVHIDAEPVDNVGYNMVFEDCKFESDQTAGVGIGLHNACHLKFKNCEFVSTASESYAPHDGYTNLTYLGAFNCHSSTNSNDTDQLLTLENCVALSKENKAYNFATNANCYMALRAFNNTFWCEGISQANGYKGSYCTIYGANHGNNAVALNA